MTTSRAEVRGFESPVEPFLDDNAVARIARCFEHPDLPGRRFELLDGGGDRAVADRFTAAEVVAAGLLAGDRAVFERLIDLRAAAGLTDAVSPLRVLHVAVLTLARADG